MSNIEKIRQEIERRKKICEGIFERESDTYYQGKAVAYGELLPFIDSLPGEIPPYCTGFKGDPDPPGISDLEQAAARYERENRQSVLSSVDIVNAFIDGAKWQANQLLKGSPLPEDTVLFQKGVEEGRRLEREDGGLAWQDIKSIVQIADNLLDDPKARVAFNNHNEEYYYKRVLDEYKKTKEGRR